MSWLKNRFNKVSVVALAVILLLIFLHYINILKPIENAVVNILSPIQGISYSIGNKINGYFAYKKDYNQLVEENKKLNEQVKNLLVENETLKAVIEENKVINNQINFLKKSGFNFKMARIIGRDYLNGLNTLIIDKGLLDGIELDYPVVIENGFLIGKIVSVAPNFSHVLLLTDGRSSVAGTIENVDLTMGVISGEHGLTMKMDLVPRDERIKEGDIVITSGIEKFIPPGLIIGEITRIEEGSSSFFKTVYLRSVVSFDGISIVSVITAK